MKNFIRTHLFWLLLLMSVGCAHRDRTRLPQEYRDIGEELRADFPFRSGMSVAEVEKLFRENNQKVDALMKENFRENLKKKTFLPPLYADRSRHLYVYVDIFEELEKRKQTSFSFWVNGRNQFWVDMAIEKQKVINIYITPGNLEVQLPAFRFDGEGKHIGRLAPKE